MNGGTIVALGACGVLAGIALVVGASACSGLPAECEIVDAAVPKRPEDARASLDAGPQPLCPTLDPIDASAYPWAPPAIALGTCTAADLTTFLAYLDAHTTATYADWKAHSGVSASCATCLFGVDGPTWHPFVEANHDLAELNVGGCIEIASRNEACGRAYQQWFDCRFEACADCPDDTSTLTMCLAAAANGACSAANTLRGAACGPGLPGYEAACAGDRYVFEGAIKAQCVAGIGDAGDQ